MPRTYARPGLMAGPVHIMICLCPSATGVLLTPFVPAAQDASGAL